MEKAFELCTSPQSLIVRNPEQSIVFYSPLANSEVDELNYATFWFISQLRPKDFILLPRSHSSRSLWEHYKKLFNYKENQAVWYNLPKNLESMTSDFHVENLIFFKNKNVIVVPFTLQEVVLNACKAVGIEAFGDLTCNAPVNVGFIPQSLTVIHIMNFRLNFQME